MTLEEGGAGRSGHASPWYALAGTCPESTCQHPAEGELMVNSFGSGENSGSLPRPLSSLLQCYSQDWSTMCQLSFYNI